MAYVRKVRTTSGAVAVQVARKESGRVVILAHLGSAHTDAELGILLEQARRIVASGQQALDIEVAVRAQSMVDVPDYREPTLLEAPQPKAAPVAPPGRTTATSSRLLYDVIGGVYDWLGFDVVADRVFRDLVIAGIVEPTSKLDASRVLADLGAKALSYRTIQRHLNRMGPGKYRDVIAEKCFTYATDCGLSLLLYDVTTLYFEAESEDDLRKVGYSKERPVDPQIVVGLKGYVTNLPAAMMPAAEVIAKYHDLWLVEKSFRMSKSDLPARPMFHYTREAIEAHLTIVFTALAVSHCVQARTGLAIGKVVKQLRPLRNATLTINGTTQTFPPEIPQAQREILAHSASNRGTRQNVLSQERYTEKSIETLRADVLRLGTSDRSLLVRRAAG